MGRGGLVQSVVWRVGRGLSLSPLPTPTSLSLLFCSQLVLPTLLSRPGQLVAHGLHNHVGGVFILEQGLDLLQVTREQGIVDRWVSAGAAQPSESCPGTWGAPLAPTLLGCCPTPVLPFQPLPLQAKRAQRGGGKGEGFPCHPQRGPQRGPQGSGQWQPSRADTPGPDYHPCSEEPPYPLTRDPERRAAEAINRPFAALVNRACPES